MSRPENSLWKFLPLWSGRENIVLIGISGFLFFVMLPFAGTNLDVRQHEYRGDLCISE